MNTKNEIEITLKKIEAILRHIKNVQDACELLGKRLIERGEIEFGVQLIINGRIHDLSKFDQFEREYLIGNEDERTLMLAIFKHRSQNKHHAEFWGDIDSMPRIYVAEMVCDMFARSAEQGKDLRDFIKSKVEEWKISTSGKTYKMIKEFVDLLLDDSFVNLETK